MYDRNVRVTIWHTFLACNPIRQILGLKLVKEEDKKKSPSIPYQTLSWFDIGQLDFFQAGWLAHQGVRGGSHGLVTDAVQNLRLQRKRQNKMQRWIKQEDSNKLLTVIISGVLNPLMVYCVFYRLERVRLHCSWHSWRKDLILHQLAV